MLFLLRCVRVENRNKIEVQGMNVSPARGFVPGGFGAAPHALVFFISVQQIVFSAFFAYQ